MYVADPDNSRVNMYAPSGVAIGSFGSPGDEQNPPRAASFDEPVGIAITQQGVVYVLDDERSPAVQWFNAQGRWQGEFPPVESSCLIGCAYPTAIAIGSDGTVFVLQGAATQVQRYSPSGALEQTWGSVGDGPGEFGCYAPVGYCGRGPLGLATGRNGLVYVADTYNDRVEAFTSSGGFVRQWAVAGGAPTAVAVTSDDEVVVAAETSLGTASIDVYSTTGDLLARLRPTQCTSCSTPSIRGEILAVGGLAASPNGSFYVAGLGGSDPLRPLVPAIQRFAYGDSGVAAPGTLQSDDVAAGIRGEAHSVGSRGCVVPDDHTAVVRHCAGFVRAAMSWSIACRGIAGTPSWRVALRYASGGKHRGGYYRPVGSKSTTIAAGVSSQGAAVTRGQATAVIGPGVHVTPSLVATCHYEMSNGAHQSVEVTSSGAIKRTG